MDQKLKDRISILALGYRNCHTFEEGEEINAPEGAGIAIKPRNPQPVTLLGDVSPGIEPLYCEYYFKKKKLATPTLHKHLVGE